MRNRFPIREVVAEEFVQIVVIYKKLRFNSIVLQRLCKEAYFGSITITPHRKNLPDLIHLIQIQ